MWWMQKMATPDNVPKGLRTLLEERRKFRDELGSRYVIVAGIAFQCLWMWELLRTILWISAAHLGCCPKSQIFRSRSLGAGKLLKIYDCVLFKALTCDSSRQPLSHLRWDNTAPSSRRLQLGCVFCFLTSLVGSHLALRWAVTCLFLFIKGRH